MMFKFINNLNLLLAQTAEQKKQTTLYVALFAFLCLMLIIDAGAMKKIGGPKVWNKIFIAFLFIAIVAMAILYFVY